MITLHAGVHHTGSTSIQSALHVTKGNLDSRHIYIPWGEVFSGDAELRSEGPGRLIRLAQAGWNPITSSEGMLGRVGDVYASAQGMAQRLLDSFEGHDFRVIVYLRPQHKWVASAYSHLRATGATMPAEEYVASVIDQPNLHYTHMVRSLTDILGVERVIFRPHTRFQDVVDDFFSVVGLGPVPMYVRGTWANALSRDGVSPLPESAQERLRAVFDSDWPPLMDLLRDRYGRVDPAFERAYRIGSEWPTMPWTEPFQSTLAAESRRVSGGARALRQRVEYLAVHGPREVRYRLYKRQALRGA